MSNIEEELETFGDYFSPGSAAEHPYGVMYQGDYQHASDGTSIAIRLHAKALASTGIPVLLKYISGKVLTGKGTYEPIHEAGLSEAVKKEVGGLSETSIGVVYPTIRHLVVHDPSVLQTLLMRGAIGPLDHADFVFRAHEAICRSTILYTVWERDRLGDSLARELKRVRENWVPCEQNAEMLRSAGVENVVVVPHPYDPSDPLCHLTKRKPIESRRFYNIGRWEPRKNQKLLIEAFAEAFTKEDDVHLTLKFHGSWEGYPDFAKVVSESAKKFGWKERDLLNKITTINGFTNRDQILKLHYENNIYVTPTCGEAWGLPAFEAKVAGNRLIHTPYGGTADFCESSDISLDYKMVEVPKSYGWGLGVCWAQCSKESLVSALKELPPSQFVRTSEFENRFSLPTVGKLMANRIMHMLEDEKASEYFKQVQS